MNASLISQKLGRRLRKENKRAAKLRETIFVAKRNLLQPNEDASDIWKAILRVS